LRVETTLAQGLLLRSGRDSITLRNECDYPVAPTVEHVVTGSDQIPFSILIQAVGDGATPVRAISAPLPDGAWTQPLPPIEAGDVIQIPLEARAQELQKPVQTALLRVSTDVGTEMWIPAVSIRTDKETR
jgi:hypothetical protein